MGFPKLPSVYCGMIYIGICIYKFTCSSFLPTPLKIVTDRYIWHTHIESHVLLVSIPFA